MPSPSRRLALLGLALLLGGLTACGEGGGGASDGGGPRPAPPPGARSLVLVTFDTTRTDFIGAYGNPLGLTPNVDALAARGVVFEDAYAPMPQTLPSHATIMTGLMPRRHLALENTYVLAEGFETLAEAAAARGYDTAAFVGALVLAEDTGIDQGFAVYDTPAGTWNTEKKGHPPQRRAKQVTDAALAWAREREGERPYFLWVHYYDPHGDAQDKRPGAPQHVGFTPPARHVQAIDRAAVEDFLRGRGEELAGASPTDDFLVPFWWAYSAEIRYTDEQFGRLLEGLEAEGMLADAVVAMTSDHGEGLYEHDVKGHGVEVWQEALQIPLVLAVPDGELAGTRVRGHALLADLRPTLERLAFGAPSTELDPTLGVDLWEAAASGRGLPARPVFLERPHFEEGRADWRGVEYGVLAAVIQQDLKRIRGPGGRAELYDLRADPAELRDLSRAAELADPDTAARAALGTKLDALLDEWLAQHPTGDPGQGARELDCDTIRHLVELGYMGEESLADCP